MSIDGHSLSKPKTKSYDDIISFLLCQETENYSPVGNRLKKKAKRLGNIDDRGETRRIET